MGDSTKSEWWRHDDEPDTRELGRLRAQSQSSRDRAQRRRVAAEPSPARREARMDEVGRELRRREAAYRPPEGVARRGSLPRAGSGSGARAAHHGQGVGGRQLGQRAEVPQMRDSSASRGGWNLPSLGKVHGSGLGNSRGSGRHSLWRKGDSPRLLALLAFALAVVLLALIANGIVGCVFASTTSA